MCGAGLFIDRGVLEWKYIYLGGNLGFVCPALPFSIHSNFDLVFWTKLLDKSVRELANEAKLLSGNVKEIN